MRTLHGWAVDARELTQNNKEKTFKSTRTDMFSLLLLPECDSPGEAGQGAF
jgi:hypothetical protein